MFIKNLAKILLSVSLITPQISQSSEFKFILESEVFGKHITIETYDKLSSVPATEEWAKYLSDSNCWGDPTDIPENSILSCYNKTISTKDDNFPRNNNIGLDSLSSVDFSYNDLTDINFLYNVFSFNGDLLLNDNSKLNDIDGLKNTSRISGNLDLSNTLVLNHANLNNLRSVGGKITTSDLVENKRFPTYGYWCKNDVYYNLLNEEDVKQASEDCGDSYLANNNSGWAEYLYYKYRNNNTSYRCSTSKTSMEENASLNNCSDANIRSTDSTYPGGTIGLETYAHINLQNNNLANLDLLKGIKKVTGNFLLNSGFYPLENFNGMNTLNTVGGVFLLNESETTNLDFLSSLTSVGNLNLSNNSALTDISGLNGLSTVGYLYLNLNPQLSDISSLSNFSSINGDLYLQDTAINDYSPLSNVTIIGKIHTNAFDEATILPTEGIWCDNDIFVNLNNEEDIPRATLACNKTEDEVFNNKEWATYLASKYRSNNGAYRCHSSTTSIAEGASLSNCYSANINTSDANFPYGSIGVKSYNHINLTNNNLDNLNFLEGINSVGTFYIDKTNDFNGIRTLTSVSGLLSITNTGITNIEFLSNLTSIADLDLSNNNQLVDIGTLSGISSIRNLNLSNNAQLSNLQGLSGLTSINELNLSNNTLLSDINVLSNVTSITGNISLEGTTINDYSALSNINIHHQLLRQTLLMKQQFYQQKVFGVIIIYLLN